MKNLDSNTETDRAPKSNLKNKSNTNIESGIKSGLLYQVKLFKYLRNMGKFFIFLLAIVLSLGGPLILTNDSQLYYFYHFRELPEMAFLYGSMYIFLVLPSVIVVIASFTFSLKFILNNLKSRQKKKKIGQIKSISNNEITTVVKDKRVVSFAKIGKISAIIMLIAIIPYITYFSIDFYKKSGAVRWDIGPYLLVGNEPSSEMVINWETKNLAPTKLFWGTDQKCELVLYGGSLLNETIDMRFVNLDENEQLTITQSKLTYHHVIYLTSLEPNTTYYYKISGFNDNNIYSFKTAPLYVENSTTNKETLINNYKNNPVRFAFTSDIHMNVDGSVQQKIEERIVADTPVFFMNGGDDGYDPTVKYIWRRFFKTYGGNNHLLSSIPMAAALGNHDINENGGRNEFMYWHQKPYAISSLNQDNQPIFYSFNYSNVHVVTLDVFDAKKPGEKSISNEQLEWLKGDLLRNRDKNWIVVNFHIPIFVPVRFDGLTSDTLITLFSENHVNLVLTGHYHLFAAYHLEKESFWRGTYYITMGTGGGRWEGVPVDSNTSYYDLLLSTKEMYGYAMISLSDRNGTILIKDINGDIAYNYSISRNY